MISKWYDKKETALKLRKKGLPIRAIERRLDIPRSTLSGWFKDIKLNHEQQKRLNEKWLRGLAKGRKKAAKWHTAQKQIRIKGAERSAVNLLKKVRLNDLDIIELLLAFLYLGEGFKTNSTGMGNSNPLILKFFVLILKNIYKVPIEKIKCELHLRADQNELDLKSFWSRTLDVPLTNFTSTSFDERTAGSPSYPEYKGVCLVRCGDIAIQRKLVYLSDVACKEIIGRLAHLARARR